MRFTLTCCLMFAVFAAIGQKVKPMLHLVSGRLYTLESNGTPTSVKSFGGKEAKVVTTSSFTLIFNVVGFKDSVYTLNGRYQSIYLKSKLPDTTFEMRSGAKDPADTGSAIMAAIVNKTFMVSISVTGRVKAVEKLDEVIKAALISFPSIDTAKRAKITGQLLGWFGSTSVTGLLETGIALFPPAGVTKNDKWQRSGTITTPSFANVSTGYQLVDDSGGQYVLNGQGIITYRGDIKPDELKGAEAKYSADGSILNEVKIDKQSGWLTGLTSKLLLEGRTDIADSPKTPGGMSIPFMYTAEITITGK